MALDQWSQFVKAHRLSYSDAHSLCMEFTSGLLLSVQASKQHYCSPKEDNPATGWNSFEVLAVNRLTQTDADTLGLVLDEFSMNSQPAGWVNIETLDKVAMNNGGIARASEAVTE